MSLYEYCRSGPLGATDPQGLIGGDTPDQLQRVYEDQIRRAGEDIAETQRLSASGALAPAWITSQRASMHFTLGVLARSLGGFMDYVDPLRRLERGQADFEAEMRRRRVPNEDDDAMVIAIGKNWPVIDILWHGAEACPGVGKGLGGVSHGRRLSGMDRFVNITQVAVLALAATCDWCANTGYNPTLSGGRAAAAARPAAATPPPSSVYELTLSLSPEGLATGPGGWTYGLAPCSSASAGCSAVLSPMPAVRIQPMAPSLSGSWPQVPGSAQTIMDLPVARRFGGTSTMFGRPDRGYFTTEMTPSLSEIGAPVGNTGEFLLRGILPERSAIIVTPGGAPAGYHGIGGATEIVVPQAANQLQGVEIISLPPGTQ
jgi:hypothetical protein